MGKSSNELLVVIDMLNGFAEEGALASENVKRLIKPIKSYLEEYSGDVVFVSDAHDENSVEFLDFPIHCIKGTWEADVVESLKPFTGIHFEKNSINAFHAEPFRTYLVENLCRYESISVIGCCTDICILNFALALKSYVSEKNLVKKIVVLKDLVGTFDAPGHDSREASESAFMIMRANGIRIQ